MKLNQIIKRGISALTVAVLLAGCSAPTKSADTAATQAGTQIKETAPAKVTVDEAYIIAHLKETEKAEGVDENTYVNGIWQALNDENRIDMLEYMQAEVDKSPQGSFSNAFSLCLDRVAEKEKAQTAEEKAKTAARIAELKKKIKEGQKLEKELKDAEEWLQQLEKL